MWSAISPPPSGSNSSCPGAFSRRRRRSGRRPTTPWNSTSATISALPRRTYAESAFLLENNVNIRALHHRDPIPYLQSSQGAGRALDRGLFAPQPEVWFDSSRCSYTSSAPAITARPPRGLSRRGRHHTVERGARPHPVDAQRREPAGHQLPQHRPDRWLPHERSRRSLHHGERAQHGRRELRGGAVRAAAAETSAMSQPLPDSVTPATALTDQVADIVTKQTRMFLAESPRQSSSARPDTPTPAPQTMHRGGFRPTGVFRPHLQRRRPLTRSDRR